MREIPVSCMPDKSWHHSTLLSMNCEAPFSPPLLTPCRMPRLSGPVLHHYPRPPVEWIMNKRLAPRCRLRKSFDSTAICTPSDPQPRNLYTSATWRGWSTCTNALGASTPADPPIHAMLHMQTITRCILAGGRIGFRPG